MQCPEGYVHIASILLKADKDGIFENVKSSEARLNDCPRLRFVSKPYLVFIKCVSEATLFTIECYRII